MHELIRTATAELVGFLAKHLPALGASWWKTYVEDRLSFQQQRTVRERGLTTLEQLDFAALLRILDQNWYELSQSLNLPREGRTWIKELQGVRQPMGASVGGTGAGRGSLPRCRYPVSGSCHA